MLKVDAATGWSLGLWFVLGLVPTVGQSMGWHKLSEYQGLAAWLQAVAASAALYASYSLAKRSHADAIERDKMATERQQKERAALKKATIDHWGGALHRAKVICRDLLEKCDDEETGWIYFSAARADIGVIFDLMMKRDLDVLDGWAEAMPVAEGMSVLRTLMAYLDKMLEMGVDGHAEYRQVFKQSATGVPDQLEKCMAPLRKLHGA